jgi:phosphoribosylanthranilate isomerase
MWGEQVIKVKICGFTAAEDARAACELGVDMIGVIVESQAPTPRSLTLERAKAILKAVPKAVNKVAVVTTKNPDVAGKVARELKPDLLQVHLSLPPLQLRRIKRLVGIELIGLVKIPQVVENKGEIFDRAAGVAEAADYILLDTEGFTSGGTGLIHDWGLSREICESINKPVFLAGGLNPANVEEAIRTVRPYGVDVSSGVESSPGRKSAALMEAFIKAARRFDVRR